jgi:hypothetical protein
MLWQDFLYLVTMFILFTLKWALNYGQVLVSQQILRTKSVGWVAQSV